MKINETRIVAVRFGLVLAAAAVCSPPAARRSRTTPRSRPRKRRSTRSSPHCRRTTCPAAQKLLGPGAEDLLSSGDPVQDNTDREASSRRTSRSIRSRTKANDTKSLVVGENDWPFPIPVVKK